ncbi:hypothetical protein [Lonepinella sp. BR2357]|uniref:hypothetical protein n=1 Tax=Lonepinella sp. BR2357 TaxID=3434549 RepID=UPI003F6E1979
MRKFSNLAMTLLVSLGAISLTACSSGSNNVPGVSVPENNLDRVQGYLAEGNTELATAQASLTAAQEALNRAEAATTVAERNAALSEAERLLALANTSLTNADKQLNSNTNDYLSSSTAASSTIVNDINAARAALSKTQAELKTVASQYNQINALATAQEEAEAAAIKAKEEAEAAALAAQKAAEDAEAAKKAAEQEAATAQALADAEKAAKEAEEAKKAAEAAAAAAKTAEEAAAAAQAAKEAEEAAKAAAEALAAAQAAEEERKAAQAAETAAKAAEEAANLAAAEAQAKFAASTTDYVIKKTDSVVHAYATEEMRDRLLTEIKGRDNNFGVSAKQNNYDYYNCSNQASNACGYYQQYTTSSGEVRTSSQANSSRDTFRYDADSNSFVNVPQATEAGSIVVHYTPNGASSYAGYAVLREENTSDVDYTKTNAVHSYVSLVDSQNKTTDKTAVTNATYKGYASHSGTGAAVQTSPFELYVNDDNVSGVVYQTQTTRGRTRTIAVFDNTEVTVSNGGVGFSGTAYMLDSGDILTSGWNDGTNAPPATVDSLKPASGKEIVTGTYQGSFAGDQAQEVSGTFEGYKDNALYMQGAFSGAK